MSNTDRWEKQHKTSNYSGDEKIVELEDYDTYDRDLIELKKLVNARKSTRPHNRNAYHIAINNLIDSMYEDMHDVIPKKVMDRDIEQALQGGEYRELTSGPLFLKTDDDDDNDFDNDVIQLRKKKSNKSKPKRQITKKRVTKKPVKKVVRKIKRK